MPDALFEVIDDRGPDPSSFVPTELSRGPWSVDSLHGGPVAALVARQLELVPADGPMHPSRLTVELWNPVPLAPLTVSTSVDRRGRRVRVIGATVADATGKLLVRAALQQVRTQSSPLPDGVAANSGAVAPPPGPATTEPSSTEWRFPHVAFHSHATEHRVVAGIWGEPGPATDWITLRVPVVSGEEPSPLQRVAAAADFGNGISGALPYGEYLFINPDMTIHLHRLPEGEWIGLDAVTWPTDAGVGQAESELFDERGRIGRSLQSLLIEPFVP